MKKNNRIYISETVVNEIQLDELYTLASQVEQKISALAEKGVKFSSTEVKTKVIALKNTSHDFTTMLGDLMLGTNSESDSKQMLDNREKEADIEQQNERVTMQEAKNVIQKLIESELDELEKVDVIDLSDAINVVIQNSSESSILEAKSKIIAVLNDAGVEAEIIKSFESVLDADSLNFALSGLYDYADENEVLIKL